MRAHVVVNRSARHLREETELSAELMRPRRGMEVVETASLEELDAAARAIAARDDVDAVVLAGGDGSYMAGVTSLARAFGARPLPPIALAPGGTVSTVARNWGLTGDPARYAGRLLDAIAAGSARARMRPTLRVRAAGEERIGFIVGAGLVARFFEVYEEGPARGYGPAARIVARVFAGSLVGSRFARRILDPSPCTIEVDGVAAPFDRVSLVCASVVRDLGLGMHLLYRAGESLDRFHAVATPLGAMRLGPQMPLVLAARPLAGPRVDALARILTLRFPNGPSAFVLDGDLFEAERVDVTAGPVLEVLGV